MAEPEVPRDFVMYGAREAMGEGMAHMEAQVLGIERAVMENPGLAFDLAKTVVEGACKTILNERKIPFDSDDGLPNLFKAVTTSLPLLPLGASNEAEARRSLVQTLSGLHSALQGVCELRNAYGFASHGSGEARPSMESVQALLAAQAADAIVGFLHRVHLQDRPVPLALRITYDGHEEFNAYVDEAHEVVRIFDLEYRRSEVLYSVDNEAYRDLLAGFEPEPADADAQAAGDVVATAP